MTTTKKLSSEDLAGSLTGHDEDAIVLKFGAMPEDLDGARFLRALLFAHHRHEGMKDGEALKQVKDITVKDLLALFREEEDPDLPGSEAGKDDG